MKASVQAKPSLRILAGFIQCLGMLIFLVGVINLFVKFASVYVTVGGVLLGFILYILGMVGGSKVEVETTRSVW